MLSSFEDQTNKKEQNSLAYIEEKSDKELQGKKIYSKDVLLNLRLHRLSLQKPKNLPVLPGLVKDKLYLYPINDCSENNEVQKLQNYSAREQQYFPLLSVPVCPSSLARSWKTSKEVALSYRDPLCSAPKALTNMCLKNKTKKLPIIDPETGKNILDGLSPSSSCKETDNQAETKIADHLSEQPTFSECITEDTACKLSESNSAQNSEVQSLICDESMQRIRSAIFNLCFEEQFPTKPLSMFPTEEIADDDDKTTSIKDSSKGNSTVPIEPAAKKLEEDRLKDALDHLYLKLCKMRQEQQKIVMLRTFLHYKRQQTEEVVRNLDDRRAELMHKEWELLKWQRYLLHWEKNMETKWKLLQHRARNLNIKQGWSQKKVGNHHKKTAHIPTAFTSYSDQMLAAESINAVANLTEAELMSVLDTNLFDATNKLDRNITGPQQRNLALTNNFKEMTSDVKAFSEKETLNGVLLKKNLFINSDKNGKVEFINSPMSGYISSEAMGDNKYSLQQQGNEESMRLKCHTNGGKYEKRNICDENCNSQPDSLKNLINDQIFASISPNKCAKDRDQNNVSFGKSKNYNEFHSQKSFSGYEFLSTNAGDKRLDRTSFNDFQQVPPHIIENQPNIQIPCNSGKVEIEDKSKVLSEKNENFFIGIGSTLIRTVDGGKVSDDLVLAKDDVEKNILSTKNSCKVVLTKDIQKSKSDFKVLEEKPVTCFM